MAVVFSLGIDGTVDIPTQIFESFLSELESTGASSEMIGRLRKTLLEDCILTEGALKTAVLGEEKPL